MVLATSILFMVDLTNKNFKVVLVMLPLNDRQKNTYFITWHAVDDM